MITQGAVEISKSRPILPRNQQSRGLTQHLDTGANASAEDAEEQLEEGAVQVNNVVSSFRLQSTSFDKKSYVSHLKGTNLLLHRIVCTIY